MKLKVVERKELEAKFVQISVPVRYGEEDIPNDFPLRKGDTWSAIIDLDTQIIENWPQGKTGEFHMDIVDEGSYFILDAERNIIAKIEEDYVPNNLLPGKYGDYLTLKIGEDGKVLNWSRNADLSDFEESEED